MDVSALLGIAKIVGVVVGQVAHMVKDRGKMKRASEEPLSEGKIIKDIFTKKPMSTLTSIGLALGGALATLPDSGNPLFDFLNAFVIGYGADSIANRTSQPKAD